MNNLATKVSFNFPTDFKDETEFVTFANFIRRSLMLGDTQPKVIGFRGAGINNCFIPVSELKTEPHRLYQRLSDLTFDNLELAEGEVVYCKTTGSPTQLSNNKVRCESQEILFESFKPYSLEVVIGNFSGFRNAEDNQKTLEDLGYVDFVAISSYHNNLNATYTYKDGKGVFNVVGLGTPDKINQILTDSINKLATIKDKLVKP